jgi:hypothetical protein
MAVKDYGTSNTLRDRLVAVREDSEARQWSEAADLLVADKPCLQQEG